MSIKDTVEMAIERSISHNEIHEVLPESGLDRERLCDELSWRCDDGADSNGVSEYWGIDDFGHKWRVHVCPVDVAAAE